MVCLFACFTTSKQQKLTHTQNTTPSKHPSDGERQSLSLDNEQPRKLQVIEEEPIKAIKELKEEKIEEQLNLNEKKEVNFDFNVKSNEKSNISSAEEKEEKEDSDIKEETESISLNVASALTNHRYKNCEDEGYEDIDLEGSEDKMLVQEESSDLFSLSIDSRKHVGESELGEREVTSPMPKCDSINEEVKSLEESNSNARDRSHFVESVLNPVENLTQWKSVKARTTMPLRDEDKENINVEQNLNIPVSAEPSFKFFTNFSKENADKKKPKDCEIGVDTSLSSWLVEAETTPASNKTGNSVANSPFGKTNSPTSHKDTPVLGVLSMEELKKLSASNSPRRLRSQTPTKTTVMGTVGSYWRHTGQATDSDSGSSNKGKPKIGSKKSEGESVNWNCSPFEAKLEKAVATGGAQV